MSRLKIIIFTVICALISITIISVITYNQYMKNAKSIAIVNTDGSIIFIEKGKLLDDMNNTNCIDIDDLLK